MSYIAETQQALGNDTEITITPVIYLIDDTDYLLYGKFERQLLAHVEGDDGREGFGHGAMDPAVVRC